MISALAPFLGSTALGRAGSRVVRGLLGFHLGKGPWGAYSLLSFSSRSLHALLALPCQLRGRDSDHSPGLGVEEPCQRLCSLGLSHQPLPAHLSLPGPALGPLVKPKPSLVLPPAWVGVPLPGLPPRPALSLGGETMVRGLSPGLIPGAEVMLPWWRRADTEPCTLRPFRAVHCPCPRGGKEGTLES